VTHNNGREALIVPPNPFDSPPAHRIAGQALPVYLFIESQKV
jgi:hypothetical protein